MTEPLHSNTIIGWREWVSLPDADVEWLKAKIDTGARSSALHAFEIEQFERDGAEWVRFGIHPWQRTGADARTVELPVHDRRRIRSSTGHTQQRFVVLMRIVLHGRPVTAEVTLTNRDEMGFRMLVGRQALRQGFLVDTKRSFVGGRAPKEVRRRNRGRVEV
ncbi:ATP-dependent zinc protease family protein [Microbacterium hominis]|uniref:ATP-dependent zinc protease n=1 Tax=Microbacterium hominis TaxID=162426 RepID=A0A7D4TH40_9MICO|nr:RimK/LysX family protein [Microbacterium hominis]QKJ19821.1 ATP-dependent zinc protease [Microbacterium hominis]